MENIASLATAWGARLGVINACNRDFATGSAQALGADGKVYCVVLQGDEADETDAERLEVEHIPLKGKDGGVVNTKKAVLFLLLAILFLLPLALLLTAPLSAAASPRAFRDCPNCPEMVEVPAGTFMMGSSGADLDQLPVHKVTIDRPIAVGKFEVTFADWEACVTGGGCSSNTQPSDNTWGRGRRPVINVSWDDAKEYVTWLVRKTGRPYRLLTEAEWEYAARAKTETEYAFGNRIKKQEAQFEQSETAEVGSFPTNAWNLHDMHGNVWEWVEDCYQENYKDAPSNGSARSPPSCSHRVVRGGSWANKPVNLRSAQRYPYPPDISNDFVGFRVARDVGD